MGVDAGGDAFRLAEEQYRDEGSVKALHINGDLITVSAKKVQEMQARYEARIAEQARLLGLQADRIQRALAALSKGNTEPCRAARAILMGTDK